ncbi:MAG: VOC family protein [Bacilli bacterium]
MSIGSIYINLPTKNVAETRAFWTKLGFQIQEQFSNEQAICVVLKENTIYAMFISHEMYATFTHKPISDNSSSQVILAFDVDSREKVTEFVDTAVEIGGKRYLQTVNEGWMFYDRFEDLDGHQWEVMFIDHTAFPQE